MIVFNYFIVKCSICEKTLYNQRGLNIQISKKHPETNIIISKNEQLKMIPVIIIEKGKFYIFNHIIWIKYKLILIEKNLITYLNRIY